MRDLLLQRRAVQLLCFPVEIVVGSPALAASKHAVALLFEWDYDRRDLRFLGIQVPRTPPSDVSLPLLMIPCHLKVRRAGVGVMNGVLRRGVEKENSHPLTSNHCRVL
jgi:hypothetical protein